MMFLPPWNQKLATSRGVQIRGCNAKLSIIKVVFYKRRNPYFNRNQREFKAARFLDAVNDAEDKWTRKFYLLFMTYYYCITYTIL